MKEQNTSVKYTRSEIDTLPDETDWERVDALTDEDIEKAALSDPDDPPTDADFWKDATVVMPENMEEYTQRQIMGIINKIVKASRDGSYIYRGEPKCYPKVSSSLWRLLKKELKKDEGINMIKPDIKGVREMLLQDARRYVRDIDIDDFELEAQLQHNGAKTSLIDFTTDYLIALFFACDGESAKDGRVILLKQDETTRDWIKMPKTPENRVMAQKSIFVQPPDGFIEECKYDKLIKIRKDLKSPMLDYLRKHHSIFPQSIYNDLQGYIKHQTRHHEAYNHLQRGVFCTIEAFFAGSTDKYDEAIRHYDKAIVLHPEFSQSYRERGMAYSNKEDFGRAVEDLTKAIELDPDFSVFYTERGFYRIRTSDYDGAISDYNWVIKHDDLNKVDAYCNLGDAYRRKGDLDIALKQCNEAISLSPIYYYPYKIRGCIYYDRNEYGKAIEDFTKAINSLDDALEDKAVVYNLRGKCYRVIGDEDRANSDFAKAEELQDARAERQQR